MMCICVCVHTYSLNNHFKTSQLRRKHTIEGTKSCFKCAVYIMQHSCLSCSKTGKDKYELVQSLHKCILDLDIVVQT